MHSSFRTRSGVMLPAALAGAWLALGGLASAGSAGGGPVGSHEAGAAVVQDAQGFAGEATCLTCHDAQTKGYHGSPHGQKWNVKSPAATSGCESCHGPGKAHADAGGDKTKIRTLRTGAEASASCTACHAGKTHAFWEGSQHDQRNVSCISCHSVHDAKGRIVRLQQRE